MKQQMTLEQIKLAKSIGGTHYRHGSYWKKEKSGAWSIYHGHGWVVFKNWRNHHPEFKHKIDYSPLSGD